MRLRAFDVVEPVPELNEPHAFAVIMPWIDVGGVGKLSLKCLEDHLGSSELAMLARPSSFFDLTRYRPNLRREEGRTEIDIPNALVTYSKQEDGHDFLFLRLPEPHMLAETYVDSVVELLKAFSVKRYCLLGSMYDMVPRTRPPLVTGGASNLALQNALETAGVLSSDYEGPTSAVGLVGQKAAQLGTETLSLVVHLPNYFTLEEDHRGVVRLMEVLHSLYGFVTPKTVVDMANEQSRQVNQIGDQLLEEDPRRRQFLERLEADYDARVGEGKEETQLAPEVEKFLQDLDSRFEQG
jgi:predicted ATP-grasp superfamily ATP-dependent carboligase